MRRLGRLIVAGMLVALALPAFARAGASCTIATDAPNDVRGEVEIEGPTQVAGHIAGIAPSRLVSSQARSQEGGRMVPARDDAVDLLRLDARVDGGSLEISIAARNLLAASKSAMDMTEYAATWHVGDMFWVLGGRRGPEGWSFFRGSAPRDVAIALASAGLRPVPTVPTGGSLDFGDHVLHARMPLTLMGPHVTALEGMSAIAEDTRRAKVRPHPGMQEMSLASLGRNVDWTDDGRFPLTGACPPPPTCPVVPDARGDATPVRGPDAKAPGQSGGQPGSQPALDLLSTGAMSDARTMVVSARIADLSADGPAGFNTLGWTMSWRDGESGRWVAQAEQGPGGQVFRVTYDAGAPRHSVSGAVFGGTATTGSIDIASGIVSVVVSRDWVEAPADGRVLRGFGASSWGMKSGNAPAAYTVFDTTEMGVYVLGITCGA